MAGTWGNVSDLREAEADSWLEKAKNETQSWLANMGYTPTKPEPALSVGLPTAEEYHASAPWRDLDPPKAASGTPVAMPSAPATPDVTITSGPRTQAAMQPGETVGNVSVTQGAPSRIASAGTRASRYAAQIAQVSGEESVPEDVLAAIVDTEDSDEASVSPAGARGLTQVVPGQGFDLPGEDASDPLTSIRQAARALKEKYRMAGGDWDRAGGLYFGVGVDAGGMDTDTYQGRYRQNRAKYGQGNPTPLPAEETPQAQAQVGEDIAQSALDDPQKWALCGPVAAVIAAQRRGGRWNVAEAKKIAQDMGLWDFEQGMHGLESQATLLRQMGYAATTGGADQDTLAREAATGNTPIISTNKHYFILTGYDPKTGKFDTTTTGGALTGGSRHLTLDEIAALGNGIQGAAYFDNPTSRTPSVAAALNGGAQPPSPPPAAGGSPAPGGSPLDDARASTGGGGTMARMSLEQPQPMPTSPTDGLASDEDQTPGPTMSGRFVPSRLIVRTDPSGRPIDALEDENYQTTRGQRRGVEGNAGYGIDDPINVDDAPVQTWLPPGTRNRAVSGDRGLEEYTEPIPEGTYPDGTPRNGAVPNYFDLDDRAPGRVPPGGDRYPNIIRDEIQYRQPLGQQPELPADDVGAADIPAVERPYDPRDYDEGAGARELPGQQPPNIQISQGGPPPADAQWIDAGPLRERSSVGSGSSPSSEGANQEPSVEIADGRVVPPTPGGDWQQVETRPKPQVAADPDEQLYLDQSIPAPPGWTALVNAAGTLVRWAQDRVQGAADAAYEGLAPIREAVAELDGPAGYGQVQSPGPGEPDYVSRGGSVIRALQTPIKPPPGDPDALAAQQERIRRSGAPASVTATASEDAAAIPYQAAEGGRQAIMEAAQSFANALKAGQEGESLAAAGNTLWSALQVAGLPWTVAAKTINQMLPEMNVGGFGAGDAVTSVDLLRMGIKGVNGLRHLGEGALSPDKLAAAYDAPGNAAQAVGRGLQGAASTIDRGIEGAQSVIGRNAERVAAAGGPGVQHLGSGVVGNESMNAATRTRVIPPHVADELDFPVRVPDDPAVVRAIEAAGGTVDERGVTLNVIRNQGPEAHGGEATRDMVFYIAGPKGTPNPYATAAEKAQTGGSVRIEGETRFRSPMILSEAPGEARGFDEAMEQIGVRGEGTYAIFDTAEGRNAVTKIGGKADAEELLAHMSSTRPGRYQLVEEGQQLTSTTIDRAIREARRAGPEGSPARARALKDLVSKYGGNPDRIDALLKVRGADADESKWAIRENIVATNARRQQYDGVVTVQKKVLGLDEIQADPELAALRQKTLDAVQETQAAQARLEQAEEAHQARPSRENWQAYQQAETALTEAKQRHADLLAEYAEKKVRPSITELADVREAANPTPPSPTAELKAAYQRTKAAEARYQSTWNEPIPDGVAEREAFEAARQAAYRELQEAEAALEALMGGPDMPQPGYTLRSDIPRRGGSGLGSGVVTGLRNDAFNAAQGGVMGAVSEDMEAQAEGREPDPGERIRRAVGGGALALAGGRYARRGVPAQHLGSGVVPGGGRGFDAPNRPPNLGDIPPSKIKEPGLPGTEAARAELTYTKPNLPGIDEPSPSAIHAASTRGEGGQAALPTMQPSVIQRIRKSLEPWGNRVNTVRYASMLSDTAGHAFNAASNIAMATADVLTAGLATPTIDAVRVGATRAVRQPATRQAFFHEVPARLAGMRAGARSGLQDAVEIMRSGVKPDEVTKLEQQGGRGFNSGNKVVDFAVEGPLRALAAADAVFRGAASGGHGAAEAYAAARIKNGGKPPSPQQIAAAMHDPKVLERINELAKRSVLQEDRALTTWWRDSMKKAPPEVRAIVGIEMPFVKTPYNVVAQGMGVTPAGLLGVIEDVAKGKSAREVEQRLGRVALGAAVMAGAAADYGAGNLTGPYPSDQATASTLPPGWRPWSRKFEVGGETYYVPLGVLGAFAIPAVVAILGGESIKQGKEALSLEWAGKVAMGVGQFAEQNTFFEGFGAISKIFDERTGEANISRHLEHTVASYAPFGGLGGEIQRIMGMPARDPDGMIEALLATNPLTAGQVRPRQDILGREASRGASGPAAAVIRAGVEDDVGVIRAFRGAKEGLPRAPKTLKDETLGKTKALDVDQRARWQRVFGRELRTSWTNAGNPRDKDSLKKIETEARTAANETILGRR